MVAIYEQIRRVCGTPNLGLTRVEVRLSNREAIQALAKPELKGPQKVLLGKTLTAATFTEQKMQYLDLEAIRVALPVITPLIITRPDDKDALAAIIGRVGVREALIKTEAPARRISANEVMTLPNAALIKYFEGLSDLERLAAIPHLSPAQRFNLSSYE